MTQGLTEVESQYPDLVLVLLNNFQEPHLPSRLSFLQWNTLSYKNRPEIMTPAKYSNGWIALNVVLSAECLILRAINLGK
jgi:hypothetical protein